MKKIFQKWANLSLVKRIIVGLILGIILGETAGELFAPIAIFGTLFVGALKAVAPILVFFLVMAAVSQHKSSHKVNITGVIALYLCGTFLAGFVAVTASFLFPVTIELGASAKDVTPPGGVVEVLTILLMNIVDNPVNALVNANYIGILVWTVLLGIALKAAPDTTWIQEVNATFERA